MISSEAQRTLVKSPPELWTELSEPTSLARHLGELGEIRITRVQAESTVEWEGELLSGIVKLEPSGWGTKVTLTINREIPTPAESIGQHGVAASPATVAEVLGATVEASEEPPIAAEVQAVEEPAVIEDVEAVGEVEVETGKPEPRRRGFFARIFSSLRARSHDTLLIDEAISEPEPVPAPQQVAAPEESSAPDASPDLTAELAAAEEAFATQDVALLTSVLDRLGAAHHRPFSRA